MAQPAQRRVDGDGHLMEFFGTNIVDYLEDPWYSRVKDAAASWAPTAGSTFPWFPGDGWDRNHGADLFKGRGNSADDWLEQLELGPLDVAVLYPSFFLQIGALCHREWPVAGSRAYNSWVSAEIVGKGNGKLRAMAVLAPQDPLAAAEELRRAVETLGLSGGMLPADTAAQFGDRSFDPLYQAAVDADVPIAVHASGTHLAGGKAFPVFVQTHAYNHPAAIIGQFTSMMFEGVFSRFPTLRVGFLECGATWVPWYVDRMDEEYHARGAWEAPDLAAAPSEYVGEGKNVFFGLEADERLLGPTLDVIGSDVAMYASDWPHWDGEYPGSLREIENRPDLTDDQRDGILHRAAERFYGLSAD
ncbi:MAG TPA: amidohydrolase family protein [Acidimicrobiales bacterium]|nr:amidohydrolase family protein [Acidimicrobiales bacterium]